MGKLPETVWHTLDNWYLHVYPTPLESRRFNGTVEYFILTALQQLRDIRRSRRLELQEWGDIPL